MSTIKHLKIKDFALVSISLLLALALFLTIGALKHPQADLSGCKTYNNQGILENCRNPVERGYPLTAVSTSSAGHDDVSAPGVVIDVAFWILLAGVITFGVAMVVPEKRRKPAK